MADFSQYALIQFGYLLRNKLIQRWILLAREYTMTEEDFYKKMDLAEETMNTIIGQNFVPSYPFFILTILQTMEATIKRDFDNSMYGFYYEYLIVNSLGKQVKKNDLIDSYVNYLTELAYLLFREKKTEISYSQLEEFHDWYCKTYTISRRITELYDIEYLLMNLIGANILEDFGKVYTLKYDYIYYYYVARYFSIHLSEKEVKEIVAKMSQKLYQEEFANIIMFLTHLSKDPFIIDKILNNSKKIFDKIEPVKLEDDIKTINNFIKEVPKLVLKEINIKKEREKKLETKDELSPPENRDSQVSEHDKYDLDDDSKAINKIAQLNNAFKTIEILGQVAKKHHGSIKGEIKFKIIEEAFLLGLRSLNLFFSTLSRNSDKIVSDLSKIMTEKKLTDKTEIEEKAKHFLFYICAFLSYIFLRETSTSTGADKLSETFKEVCFAHNYNSIRLIDIFIKLDCFNEFPFDEIKTLNQNFVKNPLSQTLLKKAVIDYLYMYKTNYITKQKICAELGIPMEKQRRIDQKSKDKKRY